MIERVQDWIMHAKLNSITFITTIGEYFSSTCINIIVVMNYRNIRIIFLCNGLVCEVEWQQCCEGSRANSIYLGIKGVINGSKTGRAVAI